MNVFSAKKVKGQAFQTLSLAQICANTTGVTNKPWSVHANLSLHKQSRMCTWMGVCSHTLTSWSRKQQESFAFIILEVKQEGDICLGYFMLLAISYPLGKVLRRLCWFVGTAWWVCMQLEEKWDRNSGVNYSEGQTYPYGKSPGDC